MSLEIQVLACDRNKTVTRTTVVNGIQVLACDRNKAVTRTTVVNGIQVLACDRNKAVKHNKLNQIKHLSLYCYITRIIGTETHTNYMTNTKTKYKKSNVRTITYTKPKWKPDPP